MAPALPPGAAPLRVQAAAAASLLADGILPEDVGAAAGLANPGGGEYTPRVLADLADAIRAAAVSAASSPGHVGMLPGDGNGSTRGADAAWSEGDGVIDYRDSQNAAWWDPESLATLLCATHRADGALQALDAVEQAAIIDTLVSHHEWSIHDVGDLLWCLHTTQTVDTSGTNRNSHNVTMHRVEELADVAFELSRTPTLTHGGFGWPIDDVATLFPRALPAPDWDGGGVSGLSAVEGCALLAAALAAGGTKGRTGEGRDDDACSVDSFASTRGGQKQYPRSDDVLDGDNNPLLGWSVRDIAIGLRNILDEPAEDGVGAWDEERGMDVVDDERRDERTPYVQSVHEPPDASPSSSSTSGSDRDNEKASLRRAARRARRRRSQLLGGDANSNRVGSVNSVSRRGAAGRGGGGVARLLVPLLGPSLDSTKRAPSGGWDPPSVARLAASLHGLYGWSVEPCVLLAADALGWEGRSPSAVAFAVATVRSPDVGWNSLNTAGLVSAMVAAGEGGEDVWDGSFDVKDFLSPMCDALVENHAWTPKETAGVLEELMVWCAEDARDLITGLEEWAEVGIAQLLSGVMEWKKRDRNDVALIVKVLVETRGWGGGGVLGKLLGVHKGEALEASVVVESDDEEVSGIEQVRLRAAGLTVSSKRRGGGEGDVLALHDWPPAPPADDVELSGRVETGADGYSADAD